MQLPHLNLINREFVAFQTGYNFILLEQLWVQKILLPYKVLKKC